MESATVGGKYWRIYPNLASFRGLDQNTVALLAAARAR